MPLKFRLCKHAEYQRAYKAAGRKQFGQLLAYFAAPRPTEWRSATPGPRVGLTVPKALGGAVIRNRIKRRLREAVRANLALLEDHAVDVILHPKKSLEAAEFRAIDREVAITFRAIASRQARPK